MKNYLPIIVTVILFGSTACKKERDFSFKGGERNYVANIVGTTITKEIGNPYYSVKDFGALGNGTDDTKALQKAINSGKPLYFPKGLYVISSSLLKDKGKLDIISDSGAIIKLSPLFPNGTDSFTGGFILKNLEGLNISGLTIDGNRTNLVNSGPNWRNYITCIYIEQSSNIKISNCILINGPSIGFYVNKSFSVKINNCRVTNTMYHGICFSNCVNATAENNHIVGIGNKGTDTAIGGIGILGTGGNYINIVNNYIDSSSDTGTKTEGCNNVVFNGNTVLNSGKDGIKFENRHAQGIGQPDIDIVYHARIMNNTVSKIYNGRGDGSCLIQSYAGQDVVIANNILTGGDKTGQEDGIQIDQNDAFTGKYSKGIIISGNVIRNTNRFIYVYGAADVTAINNICENIATPLNQYDGVELAESINLTLKNNLFKRKATTAINGVGVKIFNCAEIVFSKNRIENGLSGIVALLKSSHKIDISDNTFDNFGSYFSSFYSAPNQSVDSLVLTNNTVSNFGMNGGIGWIFKIDTRNLICKTLDLTGSRILGSGLNGDFGLTILGGEQIASLNLTDFYCNGNATYPTISVIKNCKNIIGWQSTSPPTLGYWETNSIVYNVNKPSSLIGWKCITAGYPGTWKEIFTK